LENDIGALDQVSALPEEYLGWMLERQGENRSAQLAQEGRKTAR